MGKLLMFMLMFEWCIANISINISRLPMKISYLAFLHSISLTISMTFYFPKSDFICTFILIIGARITVVEQVKHLRNFRIKELDNSI
jgi:hypothetical protein